MKRIKMIVAAVGAILVAASASAQTINDVNVKYNEAAALIGAKDYDGAITALEKTIELGLEVGDEALNTVQRAQNYLPVCHFQVGLGLCREQKFDEAMPHLTKAAELGELYGDTKTMRNSTTLMGQAYYAMGVNAFNSEDYSKAIEQFALGHEADPTNTQLGMALAESYAKSGDLENGMKVYAEIAALETRHSRYAEVAAEAKTRMAEYLTEAASALAKVGEIDEAYGVIDEILAIDATNATALLMRLQLASNAKQYDNVIKWGEETATAQTDAAMKSSAYFLLGAAYQNTEKLNEAIAQYNKVTAGQYVSTAKAQVAEIRKAQAAAK